MTQPRPHLDAGKPQGRSRTTNGAQLLRGIDGRSPIARRLRDILRGYHEEFHVTTEHERTLARQAATLAVVSEELQAQLVRGELVDADTITKLTGQLRRVLADLRQRTRADQPAPPSLHDHLAIDDLDGDD